MLRCLSIVLTLLVLTPGFAAAAGKVNVIVILADDLGWGDLGCYGHPQFKTPHLDAMAQRGARLTNFYVPVPFCAPTRGSLMTGRYPARNGLINNPCPKTDPLTKNADDVGLPESEITLAQLFKAAGYRTACIGKWHLGHQPRFRPLKRGFDEYLGILYSNDMHRVELIDGDNVVEYPVVQSTLTKRYTERALEFLMRFRDQPFFLYLPHAMPHKPLAASEDFYKKSGAGLYGDAVAELDWSVGQILAKLRELGLEESTLVIFTSDNGPWYGGSTGGLRGMKGMNWEGGLRVPFIACWPGRIPAGRTSDEPAIIMDVFATTLAAAGVAAPKDRTLDGKNLLPQLTADAKSPHDAIYSFRGPKVCTVRSGKWKLHLLPAADKKAVDPNEKWLDPRGPDGVTLLAPYEQAHPSQFPGLQTGDTVTQLGLFDLDTDRGEQRDVAGQHPEIVKELQSIALKFEGELPRIEAPKKKGKAAGVQSNRSTITHGPILGRPGVTSMGVWARTAEPGSFIVRYGLKADALDQSSSPVLTRLDHDNTGWLLLKGLQPDTHYHFQIGDAGPTGSFRTLPDAADFKNAEHNPRGLFNFRFEAGSCANQGKHGLGPALPAYATMLKNHVPEKIHFAIMNGDWLYEEGRDYNVAQWLQEVKAKQPPSIVQMAPSITGVWHNYKLYLTNGRNLAEWHRRVPSYFTFDDHEILNDVNGCGEVGLRDRRAVFRDPALQAWYDYIGWSNPVPFKQPITFGRGRVKAGSDVLEDDAADFSKIDFKQTANLHIHWGTPDAGVDDVVLDKIGGDPNAGVYGIVEVLDKKRLRVKPAAKKDGEVAYSIGRRSYYSWRVGNCEYYALDTRSHRTKHDISRPDRPDVTLLGKEQFDWLKDSMAKSDADFLFVATSVPFMIPHNDAGGMSVAAADKDDAWTVFLHEREDLIRFWEKLNKPVIVLTGDLHNSFAIRISDNVWEFCCGPHNSTNHNARSEGNRPPTGIFDSRGRKCDIVWSTYFLNDILPKERRQPMYCVIQVNNVFNNPLEIGGQPRWVAYPQPQILAQYYNGLTGELEFAQPVRARR